jgi:signal transduction histidine kinase
MDNPRVSPLAALTAQARQGAAGDPAFGVDPTAPAEIRELAAALNALVAGLRQEREGAVAASQAKTVFLGNLSHEIRSPLNSILGFAEMMLDGLYGPISPEQKKRLERMQKNGQALLALLTQVMDLAQMESGRLQMAFIDISLPVLVRTIAAEVAPDAESKGLAFGVEIAPGLSSIYTDVDHVRQILGNLLHNAIRYTAQGSVTLRALPHPTRAGFVRLAVADTGPGIPAAAQARIWEEFYQIDPTQRGKTGGAGLGLPISRKLTELLGGQIALDSPEGGGSCFYVDLPLGREA